MKKADFISLSKTGRLPEHLRASEIDELQVKHPYCAGFRVAYAMAKKNEDALDTKEAINLAAIYIQDRSKLYDYIIKSDLEQRVSDLQAETADFANVPKETVAIVNDGDKENSVVEREKKEPSISAKPLEEEMMSAAVQHLGELEVESFINKLAEEDEPTMAAKTIEKTTSQEELTFGAWLLRKSGKEEVVGAEGLDKTLINKFIQEDPKISPVKAKFFSPSQMGKMSLLEDETFVSETLARIYENQGDFTRAARAYKNLGLKNPEKRIYFAALQKKAEEQIKK